jgi:hypothetical protein
MKIIQRVMLRKSVLLSHFSWFKGKLKNFLSMQLIPI